MLRFAAVPMVWLLASCSEATPVAVAPIRPLPAYRGDAVGLFDDGIEPQPARAGLEPGASPADRRALRERTELGDSVGRVRVVTVTSTRGEEGAASQQIELHTLETSSPAAPVPLTRALQSAYSLAGEGPRGCRARSASSRFSASAS